MLRQIGMISIVATLIYFLIGCNNAASINSPVGGRDWLIPVDQVFDGGPGKDGIPALLNPPVGSLSSINYLSGNDLIIGVGIGDSFRAYPHTILDWHEIINDQIGESFYAVTYCPLTGSGIGWNRRIQDQVTTFGVSGLLYNSNLIPYDRATNSNWSQMSLQSVNGQNIGRKADLVSVIETTWKTMYPESEVVTDQTGHSKPYGVYPTEPTTTA